MMQTCPTIGFGVNSTRAAVAVVFIEAACIHSNVPYWQQARAPRPRESLSNNIDLLLEPYYLIVTLYLGLLSPQFPDESLTCSLILSATRTYNNPVAMFLYNLIKILLYGYTYLSHSN